jgi:pimeloyl-ACP methyl ester carboxylesterase/predicted glycosyltransferase
MLARLALVDGDLEMAVTPVAKPGQAEGGRREQTRARHPDQDGYVERNGVRVFYEVYGAGEPSVLLLPTWEIVHSRAWKCQIPYLARYGRVVTFDRRGNGRSDRPREVRAYDRCQAVDDAIAVLDQAGVDRAVVVSWCGAGDDLMLALEHPRRVAGLVLIAPDLLVSEEPSDEGGPFPFDEEPQTLEGWAKWNRHYWIRDWPGFLEFFFTETFTEAHSTKQIEDAIGWGLETDPETITRGMDAEWLNDRETALRLCAQVRCPTLVIQGSGDAVVGSARGAAVAEAIPQAQLITLEGSGHAPHLRDPVVTNLVLRDFIGLRQTPTSAWTRAQARGKRALYVSSPIGLGHARRDLAIAGELRKLHPDLEIDWLAQHPVTAVLDAHGERIHPASAHLASESGHFESECAEHDLHCFQALRRMDEILVANFMLFNDVVADRHYDLWIGDEAWELDYYLHENPELKTAAFVWLTDFVGYLPMADGGQHEACLTADYNAEMIEQVARYPRIRDQAIFVGDPDDIVAERFGPELPPIREWTEEHFSFPGYITGFDPDRFADRQALRAELGYRPDERVCIVTVGGSGVGADLLRRVIASFGEAKRLVAELRMIVVAGPRIDPATLPAVQGLEVRPYVHDLYRHLAACDLAIVQGGLTTAMELTANRRPFMYFPLKHHFEQNLHVRHRLDRYRAGRRMDFDDATPDAIAQTIAQEIGRDVDYRPVASDGAARAAATIAELLG